MEVIQGNILGSLPLDAAKRASVCKTGGNAPCILDKIKLEVYCFLSRVGQRTIRFFLYCLSSAAAAANVSCRRRRITIFQLILQPSEANLIRIMNIMGSFMGVPVCVGDVFLGSP
jgi:hypothetical protein